MSSMWLLLLLLMLPASSMLVCAAVALDVFLLFIFLLCATRVVSASGEQLCPFRARTATPASKTLMPASCHHGRRLLRPPPPPPPPPPPRLLVTSNTTTTTTTTTITTITTTYYHYYQLLPRTTAATTCWLRISPCPRAIEADEARADIHGPIDMGNLHGEGAPFSYILNPDSQT